MPRILIIDDEPGICWGLSEVCKKLGFEPEIASSAEQGLEIFSASPIDAVVMDVRLPGMDGLQAIKLFRERSAKIPVIIMTAFGDLQTAISAIQNGAHDYVIKPFEIVAISEKIQHAVATYRLADSQPGNAGSQSTPMIGRSVVMQEVFKQIALTTTTDSSVLITGESGTGKELAARAIHKNGGRSKGPFVPVNIAALNPSLVESELFGHFKGAFTGAIDNRKGLIEQAAGGTLFLDEVAEIPMELQVKLLRVLDQCEVTPVGSTEPVATDFRLITATNQNLLAQINHGEFRHDLFYRIRAFEVQLPPLRQRTGDIELLTEHFVTTFGQGKKVSASVDFIRQLESREWPGNVRELQNVIERAVVLARGGVLTPEHLESVPSADPGVGPEKTTESRLQELAVNWLAEKWNAAGTSQLYDDFINVVEPGLLEKAFELSGNQYSSTARRLGIHRTTLKRKLDRIAGDDDSES